MRIVKDDTIVVVIDAQEKLFPHINDHDGLEGRMNIVIKGLNELGIPLILSEQYKKGLGDTIPSLKREITPVHTLEKKCFSVADHNGFVNELHKIGRKNILLIGIEAHICVLQTAIDLKEKEFNPIVVVDAIGSRSLENKMIAIERMKQENIVLTSVESILFELCRSAGTDEFKFISNLVK